MSPPGHPVPVRAAGYRVGMMRTCPATMRLLRISLAARSRSTVVSCRRAISQSESPLRTRYVVRVPEDELPRDALRASPAPPT